MSAAGQGLLMLAAAAILTQALNGSNVIYYH